MKLGDRIRVKRKELDMTQAELAKAIGVSEATVNRYESGDILNPSLDIVRKLTDALKTNADYLMGVNAEKKEPVAFYLNPETKRIAERIYNDKDLRLLFDAAEDADPNDLEFVHDWLKHRKAMETEHDVE